MSDQSDVKGFEAELDSILDQPYPIEVERVLHLSVVALETEKHFTLASELKRATKWIKRRLKPSPTKESVAARVEPEV